ncbi:hypothetical protein BH20ACI2_BH20ACI2_14240 [soil metagenome]
MSSSRNQHQPVTLVGFLALVLSGCTAADLKTADTQQQPINVTASPTNSVAASVVPGWAAPLQEDDRNWAVRTGLTSEQVRQLRVKADASEDMNVRIVDLDTQNLAARNHVLLVTAAGNGHCLELIIFGRKGDEFQRIWSVSEMPDGAGLCRDSPIDPKAYVAANQEIIVEIPVFDYIRNVSGATKLSKYEWNGRTYELAGQTKD